MASNLNTASQIIILVDDDRTNTQLLKMLLEMDGYEVVVCPDVNRAREASQRGVDAFVIDCNLAQEGDGVSYLKEIRQGNAHVPFDLPVIMTSGDDRRASEAELSGASFFFLKPFSPSTLSKKLNELLS